MSPIRVSILIDDAYLEQIQEISQRLQAMGLEVEAILPNLGTIVGLIRSEQVNSLYPIEGIQQIEIGQSYQLAPPDSDVQ